MTEMQMRWLASRPESVQRLAAEFPMDSVFTVKGVKMWIIGYTESDSLLITPINPDLDYEGAMAARRRLCAQHLRDGDVSRSQRPV